MNLELKDQLARQDALNPKESFLVQAPAGSGKTELLIQRFLLLLGQCQAPEEILAITFTRKAAAEMQNRIVTALESVYANKIPEKPHELTTWELAKKVQERDIQSQWNLLENPSRLKILTIDSLCTLICQLSSRILEDSKPLYQQAIRQVFKSLAADDNASEAVRILLTHINNDVEQFEQLLMDLLEKREQWLPYIVPHRHSPEILKNRLETGLKNIALEYMLQVQKNFPLDLLTDLQQCAQAASEPYQCQDLSNILETRQWEDFDKWRKLAVLLLTKDGNWRKRLTKDCGFSPENPHKKTMQLLLSKLNSLENLRLSLENILHCPPLHYSQNQWSVIEALIQLLPQLTAELYVLFQEKTAMDFVELNLAAFSKLDHSLDLNERAIYLEYKIKHLLVDEFQDTSVLQFNLIERLIHNWEADDGRTIFLVGDPMQSIYRFRNAEVGLFLRVRSQGIAALKPKSLSLYLNFRSAANLIAWSNEIFPACFPHEPDILTGAVPFTAVQATRALQENASNFYPLINEDAQAETRIIIQLLEKYAANKETCAVLVRSRIHLYELLPALQAANIPFQALEIAALATAAEIQDLLSLTRALLHQADRIAWLSILRAPWCGLLLNDLHELAKNAQFTLWHTLQNSTLLNLSADGLMRIQLILPIIAHALEQRGRIPFYQLVKNTWQALGAPSCLQNLNQLKNTRAFFFLLQEIEVENNGVSITVLETRLQRLFLNTEENQNANIQIMTIHRAKGLEFDHVIIPALERTSRPDKSKLLTWLEHPNLLGDSDLILASMPASDQDRDANYSFVKKIERKKSQHELTRLFYVAVTRARKSLHLLTHLRLEDLDLAHLKIKKNTFLNLIYNYFQTDISNAIKQAKTLTKIKQDPKNQLLTRIQSDRLKTLATLPALTDAVKNFSIIQTNFTNNTADIIGTVTHEILFQISQQPELKTQLLITEPSGNFWQKYRLRLQQLGISSEELDACMDLISQAIHKTLRDARGLWILSEDHQDAKSEFALKAYLDHKISQVIIDRCFLDTEGYRWIIDYKTSQFTGSEPEHFLQQAKELHAAQLQHYAEVFRQMEQRPIKLGLYFPYWSGWIEWQH